MLKISTIVLLFSVVYYTQCIPMINQANTQSETDQKLHLFVSNGSQATDYHLTPVMSELENEDQLLNSELSAIWPFLNFMFNGAPDSGGNEDCLDQIEIQLVKIN